MISSQQQETKGIIPASLFTSGLNWHRCSRCEQQLVTAELQVTEKMFSCSVDMRADSHLLMKGRSYFPFHLEMDLMYLCHGGNNAPSVTRHSQSGRC